MGRYDYSAQSTPNRMVNVNIRASGNWITMMWMVSLTLQMKIHLQTSALANELWCSVKQTLVASDEIQVNVMQKSVVYWKWPNVVDIYCGNVLMQ